MAMRRRWPTFEYVTSDLPGPVLKMVMWSRTPTRGQHRRYLFAIEQYRLHSKRAYRNDWRRPWVFPLPGLHAGFQVVRD